TNYQTEAESDGTGAQAWNAAKSDWEQSAQCTWRSPGFPQEEGSPVVAVSWVDASRYCEWLTDEARQQGEINVPFLYRLPTEAEWERACRAGSQAAFAFGGSLSSRDANFDGNFPAGSAAKGNFLARTSPVGSYPANDWGLHDVHGNAWEWCRDWH